MTNLTDANLFAANLTGAVLIMVDFTGAMLERSSIKALRA